MLHTVRVRCCSLFHTVAAVVMFVYQYTLGWVFANLYIFQKTKGVCALAVGVGVLEGIMYITCHKYCYFVRWLSW